LTIALFDIITGIAGDMTIAALVDAGASFDKLKTEIDKLPIKGFSLELTKKQRSFITASKFDVLINEKLHNHTHLKDIDKMIDESELSEFVRTNSKKIFGIIGEAEAKIHNIPVEKIHFHEVGALDSIVDIIGCCICLEDLGITEIYTTPVKFGRGTIKTQHGIMPNPAPATVEILKDYPVEFTGINFELTTPTGAAIVKALSSGVYRADSIKYIIKEIGFGSGTFDIEESPNLLRIMLAEKEHEQLSEKLIQIETNIDDMNPQIYPYVMEKLFELGALDVYYTNVIMKKGRPGILLSVLAEDSLKEKIFDVLYSETTTLGIRTSYIDRCKLDREIITVRSSLGNVKAKSVIHNGIKKVMPEYEECKRIALKLNRPLNEVYNKLKEELNG
jgi:uncharacterized protein (TIGR00299 family) protein